MTWKQMHHLPMKAEFPCVWFLAFISLFQKYFHWLFDTAGGVEEGLCFEEEHERAGGMDSSFDG